jgi:UDP-N-acetylmuramyl tripeptide synthase
MRFCKVLALRGPNVWARFPVLEAWVDLEEFKDSPSDVLPGFSDRLMAWLPTMIEHRCGLGYRGGFFERLRTGTYMGHILEHVTLELQELAGSPVGFGKARETAEEGVYKVVIEYEDERLGRACMESAFALLMAAVHDRPFDVAAAVERLHGEAKRVLPGPGAQAVIAAAEARGIPVRRLDEEGLLVLGHGVRQRRVSAGEAADGESFVASIFPEGDHGRIPIVGVTGVNGKTTVTRLIAEILRGTGRYVGMTCTDGIYVDGQRIEAGDCSGPQSAREVLHDPRVEAAVLETARGGILREGLGFNRSDVSVVTNIGEGDHLGLADVHTPEKLAYVKSTLVDVVDPDRGHAVLNAADPLVAAMAASCKGPVFFFALDGEHPVIAAHRAKGGRAAFVRDGSVMLAEGEREEVLIPLANVPLTRGGRLGFQVENVLAAAAAAEALRVPHEAVRAALEAFDSDMERAPGRFNVVEFGSATLILDYGHNPSAVAALIEAVETFPNRTRTVIFSADGDRPDDSIVRQAALLGDAFDRVVLYDEPGRRRGRAAGEIPALLRRGLASGSRAKEIVEEEGELAAVEAAFQSPRPGDLVLIQIDDVEAALELSRRFLAPAAV